MLECAEFTELLQTDIALEIEPDIVPRDSTFADDNAACRTKMRNTIAVWDPPATPLVEHALRIVGLYVDTKFVWHASNDILMTRIIDLLFQEEFRAHPEGVFQYVDGHWSRIQEFNYRTARRLEKVLGCASFFFKALIEKDA